MIEQRGRLLYLYRGCP